MPNKTIYVSDDDLPLYKKAQELAGNLSSAISIALRKYVELEEGRLEGYDEITVRVGRGAGRKQRFSGVLLAEGGRSSKSGYEACTPTAATSSSREPTTSSTCPAGVPGSATGAPTSPGAWPRARPRCTWSRRSRNCAT